MEKLLSFKKKSKTSIMKSNQLIFVIMFLVMCVKTSANSCDAADTSGSQFLTVREMIDVNVEKAVEWRNNGVQSLLADNYHEAIGRFEMSIKLYGDYHDLNELYYLYFQALVCNNTKESLQRAMWLDKKGFIKTSAGRFVNTFKGHLHFYLVIMKLQSTIFQGLQLTILVFLLYFLMQLYFFIWKIIFKWPINMCSKQLSWIRRTQKQTHYCQEFCV
jgi:hypothetical protein